MIVSVAAGFVAIFVFSMWLAARVGAGQSAAMFGLIVGLIAALGLWGGYIVVLARYARNELREFIDTGLPQLIARLLAFLQETQLIQGAI